MVEELKPETRNCLFEYLVRLGDDKLILGHRLSEWCGHAPILEEDIALANIALDCIGQASAFLTLASEVENEGRTEDDLAYFRNETQFKNLLLVEQPNRDFAYTITRQFFYSVFAVHYFQELSNSKFEPLAGISSKIVKETTYHLRHCKEWILRLGDGTEESHKRTQEAIDDLWRFTDELFFKNEIDELLIREIFSVDPGLIKPKWKNDVEKILDQATLTIPKDELMHTGGRHGIHTEHLGHLLAEMQIVARSFPTAKW
ncbi:MAG: phenylacetate-CoA oxygenase subunit PaaC [Ignavibacteriales bacterium]|nr:phenylacetate-CoA oxygenase subunit PaaC [Ignavibacteriales bacterium]